MTSSRIKDPALSAGIEESEIAWLRYVTPITNYYCRQISQRDYRGKRLACWMHIRFNNMPMMLALAESGADIVIGACNVDSTDDAATAYLSEQGITLYGWRGMSQVDYDQHKLTSPEGAGMHAWGNITVLFFFWVMIVGHGCSFLNVFFLDTVTRLNS